MGKNGTKMSLMSSKEIYILLSIFFEECMVNSMVEILVVWLLFSNWSI